MILKNCRLLGLSLTERAVRKAPYPLYRERFKRFMRTEKQPKGQTAKKSSTAEEKRCFRG